MNGKRKLRNVACQILYAPARDRLSKTVPCLLVLPVLQCLQVPFQLLAFFQGSISTLHCFSPLFLIFPKKRFYLGMKKERMLNFLKHNKPVIVIFTEIVNVRPNWAT